MDAPRVEGQGAYAYHDWSRLIGTPVEVRKDFRLVRAGVVDDAMADSSALWLAADSVHGRALFAASEGYEMWIRPQKLDGKLCFKMAANNLPTNIGSNVGMSTKSKRIGRKRADSPDRRLDPRQSVSPYRRNQSSKESAC